MFSAQNLPHVDHENREGSGGASARYGLAGDVGSGTTTSVAMIGRATTLKRTGFRLCSASPVCSGGSRAGLSNTHPRGNHDRAASLAAMRTWRFHRVLLVLILGLLASASSAQQGQPVGRVGVRIPNRARQMESTVLIEMSAPTANLFERADEGIERADWKFAIDCLQRIIDDPEGSLTIQSEGHWEHGFVRSEGETVLYETARRRAIRRLASLPPEGLRAYRMLFDGKAKRLFEIGKASPGCDELRAVVNRYLLTEWGGEATDLLASRALDAGRAGEVIALLTDLDEFISDGEGRRSLRAAKLTAAYALLGRFDEAMEARNDLVRSGGSDSQDPDGYGGGAAQERRLAHFTADTLASLARDQGAYPGKGASWPVVGGAANRCARMPQVDPTLTEEAMRRFELSGAGRDAWRRVFADDPTGPLWLPVGQLVADEARLFVRTQRGCLSLDRRDLSLRWEVEEPGLPPAVGPSTAQPGTASVRVNVPIPARRVTSEDYISGGLELAYGLVMTVSRSGRGDYTQVDGESNNDRDILAAPVRSIRSAEPSGSRLVTYDARTGEPRWQRGRTGDPADPLGAVDFRSVPLAVDGALWVPYLQRNDLYVAVLDPADGGLRRRILLCSVSGPSVNLGVALSPAAADGSTLR